MQEFIALEFWILAMAAPCILSWLLGEVHGAARVRNFMEDRLPIVEEAASIAGITASLTLPDRSPSAAANAALNPRRVIAAPRDLSASERSALYKEMLTPTERSEEAHWRREELAALLSESDGDWAPEAEEVLSQYKVSVTQMAQANIRQDLDDVLAASMPPIDELRPRRRAYRDALEERYKTDVPERIACSAP